MEKDIPITTEEFNTFKKQMQEALSNITDMLMVATNKTNIIAENDASMRIDTLIFSSKNISETLSLNLLVIPHLQ